MLQNHVTLINDNVGAVPTDAMPRLEQLARLAGARFVLREVAHEDRVSPGDALHLQMKWANTGVGRLYRPYVLRLSLVDSSGKVCSSVHAKANPCQWLPGEHIVSELFPLPHTLQPGRYTVTVAMRDPEAQRRPFRLAIDAPESDAGYAVGRVTVR